MKIYISSPMENDFDYVEKMDKVEEMLKAKRHIVFNPAKNPVGLTFEQYMQIDLNLINMCDCIYLLPGYENSVGCSVEILHAYILYTIATKNITFVYATNTSNIHSSPKQEDIINAYEVLLGSKIMPNLPQCIMAIQSVYPQYNPYTFDYFGRVQMVFDTLARLGFRCISDSEFLDKIAVIEEAMNKLNFSERRSDEEFLKSIDIMKEAQHKWVTQKNEWKPQVGDDAWAIIYNSNNVTYVEKCKIDYINSIYAGVIFSNGNSTNVGLNNLFRTRKEAQDEKKCRESE